MVRDRRKALGVVIAASLSFAANACSRQDEATRPTASAQPSTAPLAAPSGASPALKRPELRTLVPPFDKTRAPAPKSVLSEDVLSIVRGDDAFYGILSGEGAAAHIVRVDPVDFSISQLGPVDAPATLMPRAGGVLVASKTGLYEMSRDGAQRQLRTGRMSKAVLDGDAVIWAECTSAESGTCAIGRTNLSSGESKLLTEKRFDVVNGLAVLLGDVFVAGRDHNGREDQPPDQVEQQQTMKWLLEGGPLPAGARYAPGFLSRIDEQGKVHRQHFPTQRPAAIAAQGAVLFLLTEGTPQAMFGDGKLVRITDGRSEAANFQILVSGLAMPSGLQAQADRLCWLTMPAPSFELACYSEKSKRARVLVKQDWNILGFADDGRTITFDVLTQGLKQVPAAEPASSPTPR